MFRRKHVGLKRNQLLSCRTCQNLGDTLPGRISGWALYGQDFQAYLTMNLTTS